MPAGDVALPLRIGARTLWTLRRRLVRRRLTLEEALSGAVPALSEREADDDGYLVTALPTDLVEPLTSRNPGLLPFIRQRYRRSYADLGIGFESWLAGLSAKSRSTLKRKVRRFAERSGGIIDLRVYRTEAEIEAFHRDARTVSALTYQERRLGAGLPDGEEALSEMRALARRGQALGWLLFLEGRPVAYLYAPAEGRTLVYAWLGYNPKYADLSPGTVLQAEAIRQLMDARSFRLFDFTEGDGQHKRLFATGAVDCVDLLLVRPTLANRLAGHGLSGFDAAVALAKRSVEAVGAGRALRRLRR